MSFLWAREVTLLRGSVVSYKLPVGDILFRSKWEKPQGRSRTYWRDSIPDLAWDCLGSWRPRLERRKSARCLYILDPDRQSVRKQKWFENSNVCVSARVFQWCTFFEVAQLNWCDPHWSLETQKSPHLKSPTLLWPLQISLLSQLPTPLLPVKVLKQPRLHQMDSDDAIKQPSKRKLGRNQWD